MVNTKTARELLELVTKSNAEEQVRTHAGELLKQIRTFEDAKTRYEEAKRAAKAVESEPVLTSGPNSSKPQDTPPDPSSYLREVLRAPGAGETQLQGMLVKIECEPKGMVFVVQTATGLLRLSREFRRRRNYDLRSKGGGRDLVWCSEARKCGRRLLPAEHR
jgi:hypothetical protein